MKKPTFYLASKTEHAPKWRELRAKGYDIISTWIDEAGPGESVDLVSLAMRCIREPAQANFFILYCQPGEHLKFALAELGAALSAGTDVLVIGNCTSISPTMMHHPNCTLVKEGVMVEECLKYVSDRAWHKVADVYDLTKLKI